MTEFAELQEKLQKQLESLDKVTSLLHEKLVQWISRDTDPRYKVALAEMIRSYVQLHEASLSVKKELLDIPIRELSLQQKRQQLDALLESNKIDVFVLQRALQALEAKTTTIMESHSQISTDESTSLSPISEQNSSESD
jgi:uncharacterized membrane protein YheB (UPF0754 family)